jgi:hypothetical protein
MSFSASQRGDSSDCICHEARYSAHYRPTHHHRYHQILPHLLVVVVASLSHAPHSISLAFSGSPTAPFFHPPIVLYFLSPFAFCLCMVKYNSQPWWWPGRQRSVYSTTSPTKRPSELIAHYQSVYVCLFVACMHNCITSHSQDQSRGKQGEEIFR